MGDVVRAPRKPVPYIGPERRNEAHLSEDQIEQIAERAAAKAVDKMRDDAFKAVGKTVIEKLFWIVGVLVLGGLAWLQSVGKLPNIKP
jgi:hypothetical protein